MAKRPAAVLERMSSRLTDRERFCLDAYVVNGNRERAYLYSRERESKASESSLPTLVSKWLNSEPVKAYIELAQDNVNIMTRGDDEQMDEVDRMMNNITDLLKGITEDSSDPRLKIQAAKELGSLYQLKNRTKETVEDRKTYYLPMRCEDCDVYKYVKENISDKIKPNNK